MAADSHKAKSISAVCLYPDPDARRLTIVAKVSFLHMMFTYVVLNEMPSHLLDGVQYFFLSLVIIMHPSVRLPVTCGCPYFTLHCHQEKLLFLTL